MIQNEFVPNTEFEGKIIGFLAIIVGTLIMILSILGPLVLNEITYKTSESTILQVKGQDLINLLIVGPLCIIGGFLKFIENKNAKYFLIFVPLYISLYTGLAYGIGFEWSNPNYSNYNSNEFFWLYLILIFGGLYIALYVVFQFKEDEIPQFSKKSIRFFSLFWILFISMFVFMWLAEINQVNTLGNTISGSYQNAPTVFWTVKYFDLGITFPLALLALYLFNTRPQKSYPMLLLLFSFFVILSLTVVSMGIEMYINNDPELQVEGLVIFPILFTISSIGYLYLLKDKIKIPHRSNKD